MFYDRLLNADGKKQFSPLPDPGKHGIVLRPVSGGDKDEADNDASGNSDNSSSNFHQIDHRRTGLEEDLNQMVLGSQDSQQANPFIQDDEDGRDDPDRTPPDQVSEQADSY